MSVIIVPQKPPTPTPAEKLAVGQREAAKLLSISEKTLRTWTRQGRIKAIKAGGKGRVLYPLSALKRFLEGDSSE
ncbi:MAG: helix-turn-helix domain-containing protein [Planctomycetaceae bacterium]|nr:helix-turn-helix domain-containing protein [Planctomycetaceae bacterium]